jgi:hypothetical protein
MMEPEAVESRPSRWHLLWLIPVCVLVFLFVEQHTIPLVWQLLKLARERWVWTVFFSPSAYFCWTVMIASVTWPCQGLIISLRLVRSHLRPGQSQAKVVGFAVLFVASVLVLPIVWDFLLWGTFPFNFDNEGVSRLRLIPFFPWPSGSPGEY